METRALLARREVELNKNPPLLFFASAGYMNMPPYRSVRWTSATIEPT